MIRSGLLPSIDHRVKYRPLNHIKRKLSVFELTQQLAFAYNERHFSAHHHIVNRSNWIPFRCVRVPNQHICINGYHFKILWLLRQNNKWRNILFLLHKRGREKKNMNDSRENLFIIWKCFFLLLTRLIGWKRFDSE